MLCVAPQYGKTVIMPDRPKPRGPWPCCGFCQVELTWNGDDGYIEHGADRTDCVVALGMKGAWLHQQLRRRTSAVYEPGYERPRLCRNRLGNMYCALEENHEGGCSLPGLSTE
jgi:hypothetical protein